MLFFKRNLEDGDSHWDKNTTATYIFNHLTKATKSDKRDESDKRDGSCIQQT